MINNFDLLTPLLSFDRGDFYFLQILQRKKEHEELGRNSNVVKDYYISSLEYLEKKKEEIIKLCEVFDARACLRMTPRNYKSIAFKMLGVLGEDLSTENYFGITKLISHTVGKYSNNGQNIKSWIIDIDDPTIDEKPIINLIQSLEGGDNSNIIKVPSKNGYHLLTKPFNRFEFAKTYSFDIHKDNPTNLYIP